MEIIELFFGYPVLNDFAHKIQRVNPDLQSLFIQDKEDYLQKITLGGQSYIGKNLGQIADIDSLTLKQMHIISILKKLIPDYDYEHNSLVLFPFIQNEQ